MQFWSRGHTKSVLSCPACGSNQRDAQIFERHDNEGLMPDLWRMVRCQDCKSIWLDPRPDEESLPQAYSNYYTHDTDIQNPVDSSSKGLSWRLIRGYLNSRFGTRYRPANRGGYPLFSLIEPWRLKLDYYGRHLTRQQFPKTGHLLDVGCGNGAFLTRSSEMGWRAMGCEPDPKAVTVCRKLGLNVIEGSAFHPTLDKYKFDVITLSHVLEHVDDQPALLQRLYDLLHPNGLLWIALPNPESIGFEVFGASWRELHPPFHLSIPTQSIVAKLLTEAGFCRIHFQRRGSHVQSIWNSSCEIARREELPIPSSIQLSWLKLKANLLSTLSSRFADETVVLAYKEAK